MKTLNEQLELIKRGAVEIISENELKDKLQNSINNKKPLVIKAGFDPSAPDIHLGHTVLLRKMRHFQQLGHKVVFLIGDFTGRIGDPTGQSESRKHLSKEEVAENAKTYKKQVFKILSEKDTQVVFNSEWCDKLGTEGIMELASKYTVSRLLERDDFSNRYKQGRPISVLEFLYPLIQGYDSVALKADIELGGTDQKFNLLVGREMQREYKQPPQVVITMPLLEGTDGVNKMSKSLGNYIGINEKPKDIFGKIMSVSDDMMFKYYELLTDDDVVKIKSAVLNGELHPKLAKMNLAKSIVGFYCGDETAAKEFEEFDRVFKKKEVPQDMPLFEFDAGAIALPSVLVSTECSKSISAARRLIEQGAVSINGEKITDIKYMFMIPDEPAVLKAGKIRFVKVVKRVKK